MSTIFALLLIAAATPQPSTMKVPIFGEVHLYGTSTKPLHVILFLSGDGGWNKGVVAMAKSLAIDGALVAGIDTALYLKRLNKQHDCGYPAADFEMLSKAVQKQAAVDNYTLPVVVGYSSGATLAYVAAAQAAPGVLAGAVSLGFCTDLPMTKAMCRGHGMPSVERKPGQWDFGAVAGPLGWRILHGNQDQVGRFRLFRTSLAQCGVHSWSSSTA